jgi:hypothetical protein
VVFGAICRFDDAFLLLKLFLDPPSLSHASGKCHRRDYEHRYPQLQSDQRLIFCFSDKRAEATQSSPHGDHREYKNARSRFAWTKAKRRPNHDGAANESDGIIPGRNFKPPSKDDTAEQHEQQKKHADFGSLLLSPTSLKANAPE